MSELKAVNFTIVPDTSTAPDRIYANFCAVAHTPFDVTLSFCEVLPLGDDQIRAINEHPGSEVKVQAPVRARVVLPFAVLENLVVALQAQMRTAGGVPGTPVH
jgi:Protein of unknown function (DUF3467)